ncbi:hypothetical protein Lal_00040854 [Lupinus albus]|uniref:Putative Zf-FLZ domain-containing protein n=1 Tax=Lupinus albus TaxID=3870 RepID=A0A6A4PKI3_LUPAL|nr:putative Zf-FLZ domain-containing protein [Lupinus albus]KAF1887254.1 hypothetical protein Lal_00040854 [Lupinus albus]
MVGLSVVLEGQKGGNVNGIINSNKNTTSQVINKTTMMLNKPSPPPSPSPAPSSSSPQHSLFQAPTFLDQCFLCRKRLLPGKDIYMYNGDKAFCSVDCRSKQIYKDEVEAIQEGNCSSSSSSSSSSARHNRRGARTQGGGGGGGGFAYS